MDEAGIQDQRRQLSLYTTHKHYDYVGSWTELLSPHQAWTDLVWVIHIRTARKNSRKCQLFHALNINISHYVYSSISDFNVFILVLLFSLWCPRDSQAGECLVLYRVAQGTLPCVSCMTVPALYSFTRYACKFPANIPALSLTQLQHILTVINTVQYISMIFCNPSGEPSSLQETLSPLQSHITLITTLYARSFPKQR